MSVTLQERQARLAVSAFFLTNGAIFANIVPRFPEIKASLGLNSAEYGLAVAAFPAGAIVAGLAAAFLIRAFSSARVAMVGTFVTAWGLFAATLLPNISMFVIPLFIAGGSDAIIDVSQNAHGLRVQRRYPRSIFNSFHATWSIGAVLGGLMSVSAIALNLSLSLHMGISATLFSAVGYVAYRYCLPGPDDETRSDTRPSEDKPRVVTLRTVVMFSAITLMAIAGTSVEDSGNSWATLYLGELGAEGALAGIGYISLVASQTIGRFMADRLVDRFGQRAIAGWGGVLIAMGMGTALAFPSVPLTIIGFGLAGLGCSTTVPAAMDAAERIPGLRQGTGLTIISWLMRLGVLLSPPLVGAIAEATSLRTGLLIVPLAGVIIAVTSTVLSGPRNTPIPRISTEAAKS